ncbi:MAG: HAMP domain-containing histidine kinase [Elusimicrobia bacterium]|nr:HAMP domain-containing histidine kinase [Elusimicrobiota bacterium]
MASSYRKIIKPARRARGLFSAPWAKEGDRRELYSALSHLFRNPLNGACGFLDYLFSEYAGPLTGDQQQSLGQAREAVLQLQKSVDILLDVAAFDFGLVRPSLEILSLNDFWARQVQEAGEWLAEEGLSIALEFPSRALWVAADARWLKVHCREILSNAVRVSPKESTLRIRLARRGSSAVFRVTDQGPGVPADQRAWIFQPLTQLKHPDDPPKGDKGGLGLALAERVAVLHGGRVWAEPEPGGGLSIVTELPLAKRNK